MVMYGCERRGRGKRQRWWWQKEWREGGGGATVERRERSVSGGHEWWREGDLLGKRIEGLGERRVVPVGLGRYPVPLFQFFKTLVGHDTDTSQTYL
jgi:hypothetical protein